jgi:tRNA(Ile)-lysidine synthase
MSTVSRSSTVVSRWRLTLRVQRAIRTHGLCVRGDHILAAVSGGADSVALLAVLHALAPAWNWRLTVAHINYGLRGQESEQDARFVIDLCRELDVPVICEAISLGTARASLQARAREARYALFAEIAARIDADKIALGHTADDQAETLLMWTLRGAGTGGLAGIPQMRNGKWIRPLLDVPRGDVEAYLLDQGRTWRTDSSNLKPLYTRNRIRLEILPVLKAANPAIVRTLGRQARILRDEDQCLDQLAQTALRGLMQADPGGAIYVDRDKLLGLPVALQRRVVRAVLRSATGAVQWPTFGAVDTILRCVVAGRTGSMLHAAGGLAWRDYGRIGFQRWGRRHHGIGQNEAAWAEVCVSVETGATTAVPWAPTAQVLRVSLEETALRQHPGTAPRSPLRVMLDMDRIAPPVVVRSWRPGDSFQPTGMGGRRKKLQDYFADIKLPRAERHRVPLVCSRDHILWVAGHRPDQRVQATPASTRLLILELAEPSTVDM